MEFIENRVCNLCQHSTIKQLSNTCIQREVLPTSHLTYSTGPRGSLRLRQAVASFLEEEFKAHQSVTSDDIFITPGLTSALDSMTWAMCNEGEGILIPTPYYNGFQIDLTSRSDAGVIEVAYKNIKGTSGFDDMFDAEFNEKALEVALYKTREIGIEPRGLLISKCACPSSEYAPVYQTDLQILAPIIH